MSFSLNEISNVMLGVRDLAESLAFYRDQLKMTVKFEIPGLAFLDGGSITLCLSEPLGGTATGKLAGAVEVVFAVPDIDAAYAALCDQGVAFTHAPHQV